MDHRGNLFVFEGPDGVGKTELAKRFAALLEKRGISCVSLSFPGKSSGSVGKLVYELHHSPQSLGVTGVSPSSLQLLHIAAHLDAIERTILPTLRQGTTVILDRFWWSTKVYGLAGGMNKRILSAMIEVELAAWGTVLPTQIFLIKRRTPLRNEPESNWQEWSALYEDLSIEEGRRSRVLVVENEGSIEEAVEKLEHALTDVGEVGHKAESRQLPLELSPQRVERVASPTTFSAISPAIPSAVYDTYWRFAAERQEIFFRRWRHERPPWTSDPILTEFKFTNAYRASDRVSQFLIRNVIYHGDQTEEEIFFRVILFKLFNKIETWALLEDTFGELTYRDCDLEAYDKVLLKAISQNQTIYSGAYIMPSGSSAFRTRRKHRAHLKLLEQMMKDEVPLRIAESKHMLDAFTLLRSYPMLGDFLAYQYVTDLNYSTLTNFSEMEFVVPGPGAKGGMSKCFTSLGGLSEADIIRLVTERQSAEFERLGIDFKPLWGRPLQLIDCQNLFCEVDKYARVYHPEVAGERTRIKQRFRSSNEAVEYWYPPKWGLNDKIKQPPEEVSDEIPRLSKTS